MNNLRTDSFCKTMKDIGADRSTTAESEEGNCGHWHLKASFERTVNIFYEHGNPSDFATLSALCQKHESNFDTAIVLGTAADKELSTHSRDTRTLSILLSLRYITRHWHNALHIVTEIQVGWMSGVGRGTIPSPDASPRHATPRLTPPCNVSTRHHRLNADFQEDQTSVLALVPRAGKFPGTRARGRDAVAAPDGEEEEGSTATAEGDGYKAAASQSSMPDFINTQVGGSRPNSLGVGPEAQA